MSLRWAVRRRPTCWLRGHRWAVMVTSRCGGLLVCGRCLAGDEVAVAPSPLWLARQAEAVASVDPLELALRLVSAAVDGEPEVVGLGGSVRDQPLAASVLAAWLAGLLGDDLLTRRQAVAALSLRVQLDRLGS